MYVPLDFDSRFLGKEIIGVFANRFGKSGISIILSMITSFYGDLDVSQLSLLTTAASTVWLTCSVRVSYLVSAPNATGDKDQASTCSEKTKKM